MKKKIFIISIIIILCIAIVFIGFYINKNNIPNRQINEDSSLESENDLLSMKVSNDIENIEDSSNNIVEDEPNIVESNQEETNSLENETNIEQKFTQVKSSTTITNKAEKNNTENKSETTTQVTTVNKETTKENIPSTVSEQKEETKVVETPAKCTNNNNHSMDVGNSGQWFSNKNDAIAYYNSQVSYWGNLWETEQIDDVTYYKKCPSGYEVWSCMYCSKWTINFYYR